MHLLRWFLAPALASALLIGCASQTPAEPTAAPAAPAATVQPGYPAPTEALGAGYPLPTEPASAAYPVPTDVIPNVVESLTVPAPASNQVGVVTGRLLRLPPGQTTGGQPFPANLYLGKVLASAQGEEGLVELNPSSSPLAQIDAQGRFVFSDIPIGRYGLMLDTPRGAVLLNNPTDSSAMVVEITGGNTVDLGDIAYDLEGF
jgi:hypothetical protein